MPNQEQELEIIPQLEKEIDVLKSKIHSLNGQELYDAAKQIVENMDLVFCLEDIETPLVENLPIRKTK